ncbi:hypothetical protein ACTL32_02590 [Planococcus sp. FY231025]|uniref:hypothetical protein n=1 Tax=Planococcus sp. FY231025 TaxID=3455699 RepID=UPI003F8E8F6B
MKFTNKFIIGWWIMLLIVFGIILIARFDHFTSNTLILFDYIILILLFILVFLPLYSEMSMFGFSLKREIESVEESVNDLKSLVISNTNSNVVYFNADPQLTEEQRAQLKRSLEVRDGNSFESAVHTEESAIHEFISAEKTVINFFAIRYLLEKEIRRIAVDHISDPNKKPVLQLVKTLSQQGIFEPNMLNAILEVWSITSAAMHGEDIGEADENFVESVGQPLLHRLKGIL